MKQRAQSTYKYSVQIRIIQYALLRTIVESMFMIRNVLVRVVHATRRRSVQSAERRKVAAGTTQRDTGRVPSRDETVALSS